MTAQVDYIELQCRLKAAWDRLDRQQKVGKPAAQTRALRDWTKEEDAWLRKGIAAGKSRARIANELGRSIGGVNGRINLLRERNRM